MAISLNIYINNLYLEDFLIICKKISLSLKNKKNNNLNNKN